MQLPVALVWATAALCVVGARASVNCDDVVTQSSSYTGTCTNKWKNVKSLTRPTQSDVGFAWVQRKFDKDFDDEDEAQSEIDNTLFPVVLGPNPNTSSADTAFYLTDGHHTLSALDWSGYDDVKVTFDVIADLRAMALDDFWAALLCDYGADDWARAQQDKNALPTQLTDLAAELPARFAFSADDTTLGDDPWRALASFVRKTKNDTCVDDDKCMRCYYRECNADTGDGIPFFEFRWSYFLNEAYLSPSYWPSESAWTSFVDAFDGLGDKAMGSIDYDAWQDVADTLTNLCRGDAAGAFELPVEYFEGGALPGYTAGYKQLPEDPDCNSASFDSSCGR